MNKKISFFHFDFPCGGAEKVTINIADYVTRLGYEVYVYAAFFHEKKLRENSTQNFIVKLLPDQTTPNSIVNADYMIKCIRDFSIGIFVLPGYNLATFGYIKAQSPECKFVFSHHGKPFFEIENKQEWVWRRSRKNAFSWMKWILIDYLKYSVFKYHRSSVFSMYKNFYDSADAYTVLCEGYKKQIIKTLHLDEKEDKISIMYNSEKRILNPNLKKKRQILYVGRLTYADKRVDRLLDIWGMVYEKAPDWDLVLIGDGEERANLEKQASDLHLKNIHFKGYRTDVGDFYHDASFLCLTSAFEGWGLCLTEAQAHGVIPIAFGCSEGVKEILSPNREGGFIISPFNRKEYAETLLSLMKNVDSLEPIRLHVIEKSKNTL